MLTLATNAIPVIRQAISRYSDDAGLRITPTADGARLGIELAQEPAAGDHVIVANGARVFVSPDAERYVGNLEMYAVIEEGDVRLALREPITATGE
jgi:Fe-S cluster assembly iron-binding protein IscA